jgi:hypothetical protein
MSSSKGAENGVAAGQGGRWTMRGRSIAVIAGASALCGVGLAASGVTLMRAFDQVGFGRAARTQPTPPEPRRVVEAPPVVQPAPVPTSTLPAPVPVPATAPAPSRSAAETAAPAAPPSVRQPGEPTEQKRAVRSKPTRAAEAAPPKRQEAKARRRAVAQAESSGPAGFRRAEAPAGSGPGVRAYALATEAGARDPSGARIVRVIVPSLR